VGLHVRVNYAFVSAYEDVVTSPDRIEVTLKTNVPSPTTAHEIEPGKAELLDIGPARLFP
jgi:hypothetical protein